jgi:hypothetical protein
MRRRRWPRSPSPHFRRHHGLVLTSGAVSEMDAAAVLTE